MQINMKMILKNFSKRVIVSICTLCFLTFFQPIFNVVLAQNSSIVSGKVVGSGDNDPIIGVNVVIKGLAVGAVTDINGKFSLNIPGNANDPILIFTFIGFKTQEVPVNNRAVIDIKLEEDITQMSEVVVVGYGSQKKVDLTASVSNITTEGIETVPYVGIDQVISGKATGVNVQASSGLPGAGSSIKIRGITSLSGSEPLYVIDGVILSNLSTGSSEFNPLAGINPNDIASISILKDASATAIYGSRGAAGVVLITTKNGKKGETRITFNSTVGVATPYKQLEVLGADDYYKINKELLDANGAVLPYYFTEEEDFIREDRTNWQDQVFQTGLKQDYNISISGGSDNASFYVSLNHANQQGHIIETYFKRYGIRVNSDFRLKKFRFGQNLNVSLNDNRPTSGGALNSALNMSPYTPLFDDFNYINGYGWNFQPLDGRAAGNPVAEVRQKDQWQRYVNVIGNIYGEFEIIKNLTFKTSVGLDVQGRQRHVLIEQIPLGQYSVIRGDTLLEALDANLRETYIYNYSPLIENTLSYSPQLGENHSLSAVVGQSAQTYFYKNAEYFAEGYLNTDVINPLLAESRTQTEWEINRSALLSFFGRINYSFKEKYLVQVSFRRDGSSKFYGGENKWADFPSFSAGWKLHEESFFDVPFITELKLRGGYGISGNDRIRDYAWFSGIHTGSYVAYALGPDGTRVYGATTGVGPGNPDIKWETTAQYNIGLDLGLFKDQLTMNFEYFKKNTYDILWAVPVSLSRGFGLDGQNSASPIANVASLENTGIEGGFVFRDQRGDFGYSVGANVSLLANKITSFGSGQEYLESGSYRNAVGEPMSSFYGWVVDKVYATNDEVAADNLAAQQLDFDFYQRNATSAGDIRFKDLNGDGRIDNLDRTYLGNPIPDAIYNVNMDANYKRWSLALNFNGAWGAQVINRSVPVSLSGIQNYSTKVLSRWQINGDVTDVPRAIQGDPSDNNRISDRFVEDADFIRLQNLTVGYTFTPTNVANEVKIFFTGQNLLMITGYTGFDPEIAMGGGSPGRNLSLGTDNTIIPYPRTLLLGLNVSF